MYLDILSAILQAASSVLTNLCRERSLVKHLCQIDARELSFPLVAATHSATGPIHRIILGCETELADTVAAASRDAHPPSLSATVELDQVFGFQLIVDQLHQELVNTLGQESVGDRFLQHDREEFRVRTKGITTFYAALNTAVGDLHLIVDFARRENPKLGPILGSDNYQKSTQIETEPEQVVVTCDRTEIASLLADLTGNAADVLIRSAQANVNEAFFHAMIVNDRRSLDPEGVTLSSPFLLQSESACAIGHEVVVVLTCNDRLLQFTSTIADLGYYALQQGALLPVLRLTPPLELTPGQRRSASRVLPATRILGTIHSATASPQGNEKPGRREISILVKDLSENGARIALTDQTLLSRFKWGSKVICRLRLPEPYGRTEVLGIIQRLLLYPDYKQQRRTHLGVEFLSASDGNENGLANISRYVREQRELARKERLSRLPGHLI
jgi:hypothetical protein